MSLCIYMCNMLFPINDDKLQSNRAHLATLGQAPIWVCNVARYAIDAKHCIRIYACNDV